MKVRTVRKHINAFGPTPVKNIGRKYEVSDRDGRNLIAAGLVVEDGIEVEDVAAVENVPEPDED